MKQVKNNLAFMMAYRIITVITPLITSPVLSRALGAEKLGLFSATLSFVNYYQLIAMLGIENYGNRCIAASQGNREKQQRLFWNIYAVQALSCVMAIALYASSLLFIPRERVAISSLQGIWLIGSLFNINWFFFGVEQFKMIVSRNVVVKVVTVILTVLLVKEPGDIYIYVLIMAGDTLLSNMVLWPFLSKHIKYEKPHIEYMKSHIAPILILFVPIMAISVFHVMDKTMLDMMGTPKETGYYYAADKIINIPLTMVTAISSVMMPRISKKYSEGKTTEICEALKGSTELTMFLSLAVGFGIAAISDVFVPWFLGNEFEPCVGLVNCFVPVLFAKAIGDLVRTQYMIPANMDREYTVAVILGAGVNIVSNYALIREFEAMGAVLGTLLAESAVTLFELLCTRKRVKFGKYLISSSVYLVPALAMLYSVKRLYICFSKASPILQLMVMVFAGAGIYILLSLAIWHFKRDSIFRILTVNKNKVTACRRKQ